MKKTLLTALATLGISIITIAQVPSYVPTNGLVGWWPFNGNANDESANGNDGSIIGNTVLTNDRFGNPNKAYSFDGNGDYIDCGNAPSVNITGSLTISAWIYATDLSNTRGILTKSPLPPVDDAYQLVAGAYVQSDLNFLNSDYGYLVPTMTWVHIVSVFDSNAQTISLYTDGLLDTTINVAFSSIGTSTDNLCLGTHRPTFTTNWSWNGILDDMAIWNRPLTQQEIADLYNTINVGMNENSQDNLFSVFPNPSQSIINVKTDIKLIGQVYSIYDNIGRIVLSGKLNSENTTIELGNLSGGIYMFSVGDNMKQSFKVIKE